MDTTLIRTRVITWVFHAIAAGLIGLSVHDPKYTGLASAMGLASAAIHSTHVYGQSKGQSADPFPLTPTQFGEAMDSAFRLPATGLFRADLERGSTRKIKTF